MSLIDEFASTCALVDKRRVPDGEGGWATEWVEGAKFKAAIVLNTSVEAQIAERQQLSNFYSVTTAKNVNLEYHDVFRRLYDGKFFRVTSDGNDKSTPNSASIDMRQVTAEEYALPDASGVMA